MNKKGFQLAISTLVILVLAVVVMIGLILAFTGGFERFMDSIRGYSGSDVDGVSKVCQTQCNLDQINSFCCEEKKLGREEVTCLDEVLYVECDIDCEGVCQS